MKKLFPRINYNYNYNVLDFSNKFHSEFDGKFLADLFDNDSIYFLNSGRTALRLLLNSLGLKTGSKIGVQIYNCDSVFISIKQAGFEPVFIDIDENLKISLNDLRNKSDEIDALILTHLFGFPNYIKEVKEIAGDKPIIEDCAHSFLSKYNDNIIGTFADAAFFSTGNGKFPSFGLGGFTVINNKKYLPNFFDEFEKLSEIDFNKRNRFKNLVYYFLHRPFIYNYFTYPFLKKNKQAGSEYYLEKKLTKNFTKLFGSNFLGIRNQKKIQEKNAKVILDALSLKIENDESYRPNFFLLPLIVNKPEEIIQESISGGCEIGQHFKRSILWAGDYSYEKGSCPVAEKIIPMVITLPTYIELPNKLINLIKENLYEYSS